VTRTGELAAYRILVPAPAEDEAVALLWEQATTGVEVRPAGAGAVELLAYFEDSHDRLASLGQALAPLRPLSLESAPVPIVDWVARFREGFRPFRVGRFTIVPAWESGVDVPDLALFVDPGRAFGTGTHETTRLCLACLEELAAQGRLPEPILDLGAGTAILSIAAWRLGAARLVAVDNDADAVRAAREHARLNRAPIRVVLGDAGRAVRSGSFGLVLANIAAPLLRDRAAEIAGLVAPGGRLVLSGFLESDLAELRSAYAGLGAATVRRDGEWAALVFTRAAA